MSTITKINTAAEWAADHTIILMIITAVLAATGSGLIARVSTHRLAARVQAWNARAASKEKAAHTLPVEPTAYVAQTRHQGR
jgi:hypothetical protein